MKGGWELHGSDDEPISRTALFFVSLFILVGVLVGGFML